jgi:CRISPR/Cas system-associated exonuclease Cas4 (RecB family)
MLPIKHLSVSSLKEFLACPRKFRLRRIDGVVPAFRPVSLAFGSAFHEGVALGLYQHSQGEPPHSEATADHFRQKLREQINSDSVPVLYDDQEDEGTLADKGIEMLDAFWKEMPLPRRVLGIEQRFALPIHGPNGEELPPLIGSIDAVVETDSKPTVWELKTGKQRWSEDKLEFDFQPSAYQRAFRARYGQNPELQLAVITKARKAAVQLVKLRRTREDEKELIEIAASVCRAIEAGVDHPIRSWGCKNCEYAESCR